MPQDWDLSEELVAYMDRIVDRYQIDVDTFSHNLTEITVMFEDGGVQTYHSPQDADYTNKPIFTPVPASFVVVLPKIITLTDDNMSNAEKTLRFIRQRGTVSRKEVETLLGSSKFPAIRALNELLAENKIVKTGSGPAVRYSVSE